MFDKKPTYFKLIYELRIKEANIINIYNKRYSGFLDHEYRRKMKIEEIIHILNDNNNVISGIPNRTRTEKKLIALQWFEFLQRIRFSNLYLDKNYSKKINFVLNIKFIN